MKKFFERNIDFRGRLVRGVFGSLLLIAGLCILHLQFWVALGLIIFGLFVVFESLRGWCLMRACGFRTRL
jgi:hypothetical protein